MFAYTVRRLFAGIIMLILMSIVTFALFFASPVDHAKLACGKNCTIAQQKQVNKALGFDKPVQQQWVDFAVGVFKGRDYPEDMNSGLEAMMRQHWSRDAVPQMLFLLADAPPQQYAGQDYTYHEAIQDAAANGIAIYPVAASGVDKPTEFLFRAMAVMTGGKYVFLTDDSGVGDSHEEPDITGYKVEKLNDLMVREIRSYVAAHTVTRSVAEDR